VLVYVAGSLSSVVLTVPFFGLQVQGVEQVSDVEEEDVVQYVKIQESAA
jgi:hypothetical protein